MHVSVQNFKALFSQFTQTCIQTYVKSNPFNFNKTIKSSTNYVEFLPAGHSGTFT